MYVFSKSKVFQGPSLKYVQALGAGENLYSEPIHFELLNERRTCILIGST